MQWNKKENKVYAGDAYKELFTGIDGIYAIGERYRWDVASQNSNGGKLAIQYLGWPLKGHTEKWLNKLLSNMRNPTWISFKDEVHILVEDVMEENAY